MKPLLISSGEPAGIGPDLCLALAESSVPLVVLGDKTVLAERAEELKKKIHFQNYEPGKPIDSDASTLTVYPIHCLGTVKSGELNPANAAYVLKLLSVGAQACQNGEFSALVTAPVHKANINAAGFTFTGHTEFFAEFFQVNHVVMMLACDAMKVALMTTHLPLREVAQNINPKLIIEVINILFHSLIHDFAIPNPRIKVAGLNPHAGESGYLGREELDVISPALEYLRTQGLSVEGPLPADTLFTPSHLNNCDAFVAMYHDQGLPVLKYAGFNQAVNITLGLPIIRTSVDHGTALELAGKNSAHSGSLFAAVQMALVMVKNRTHNAGN